MKNMNFHRLASCTTGRASGLHIKAGCTLSWAAELGGLDGYPFLQYALPFSAAHPSVFCAARRKFKFFIWKHSLSLTTEEIQL